MDVFQLDIFMCLFLNNSTKSSLITSQLLCFCLFILLMGFSQQEYWNNFLFPPPMHHVFSKLFIMTHLFWVALQSMLHSFIELCKPLHQDKVAIHEGELDHKEDWVMKKMLTNCGAGEDFWESLGWKGVQISQF